MRHNNNNLAETLLRAEELASIPSYGVFEEMDSYLGDDFSAMDDFELEACHVDLDDLSVNGGIW